MYPRDALATAAAELDHLVLLTPLDESDSAQHRYARARGHEAGRVAREPRPWRIGRRGRSHGSSPRETDQRRSRRVQDRAAAGKSEFWELPNVQITPHAPAIGLDYFDELVDLFQENLARYRAGEHGALRNRIA